MFLRRDDDSGGPEPFPDAAVHRLAPGQPVNLAEVVRTATDDQTSSAEAFVAVDEDCRVDYLDERAASLFETTLEEARGEDVETVLSPRPGSTVREWAERAVDRGSPESFVLYLGRSERRYASRVVPGESGCSVFLVDAGARPAAERQRDRLAHLTQLNSVVHGINEALAAAASKQEIEQLVCDGLQESPLFSYVWLGRHRASTGELDPTATAGNTDYAEQISVSTGTDDYGSGPGGNAVRKGSVQVVDDIRDAPEFEPWRERALAAGFRSSASVPATFKGTTYAVVNVYAPEPNVFTDEVVDSLSQLGSVLGLAYSSTERRAALIADQAIELKLKIKDPSNQFFQAIDQTGVSMTIEGATAVDDHTFTYYASVQDLSDPAAFEAAIEDVDWVETIAIIDQNDDEYTVATTIADPPVSTMIAEHGGTVRELSFEGDACYVQVELPRSSSIRTVVDVVDARFDSVQLLAKREHERPERRIVEFRSTLEQKLTERQREVIETAMHAGYFEWPRRNDAEEIAATLNISSPTFHEHLRAAQLKLLTDLFETRTEYVRDVE
ncbi:bacterio-opsin activator domain-containing protein [Haloarchaeobius sp. TZWWS8]|uniref:bacterio-opsin activator domain-containing protein n=1 Tax=Haloarchaeobius sp. TZWWS8 TaxID=3446121 RepID=UPI003EBF91D0